MTLKTMRMLNMQATVGQAVRSASQESMKLAVADGFISGQLAFKISDALSLAAANLVGQAFGGEGCELMWDENARLKAQVTRLGEQITLQAIENTERTSQLLEERWTGLKARVAELEQERVSLQEGAKKSAEHIAKLEEMLARAKRYVPQGDCDQITIKKADQIMERDGLVPSGLILLNPRSGQRAYLEAGCVRWLDQDAGYFFMRPDRDQDSQLVSVGLAARPSAADIEGLDRDLKQELAEWSKLRKLVPSGPAGAINCRKAEKLLEQPHMRTTGLVLANTETGDRTIIDMSAVRWMESGEFQELMHPTWAPLTAGPTAAPGTPAAGPARVGAKRTGVEMSRVSISRATLDLVLKSFRMDAKGTKFSFRGEFADEIEADVREIPGGLSPLTPCQGHAAQSDADGWIVWDGRGPFPLKNGIPREVKFRDGSVSDVHFAVSDFELKHYGDNADIVAYRVAEGGAA